MAITLAGFIHFLCGFIQMGKVTSFQLVSSMMIELVILCYFILCYFMLVALIVQVSD